MIPHVPPGAKWLRDPGINAILQEVLSPEYYAPTKHLFNWDGVRRIHTAHTDRTAYYYKPLWALASFQVWARKHKVILN